MRSLFSKYISTSLLTISIILNSLFSTLNLYAAEGMWIMPNVPDSVVTNMEDAGMEFDSDWIYSEKKSSLKDVTVYLSNGYTATIISNKGLMIAPYDAVSNYIPDSINVRDGYLSPSVFKEIPLGNLNAWILQRTEDVTYRVTSQVEGIRDNKQRDSRIEAVKQQIVNAKVVPANHVVMLSATTTGKYYLNTYKRFNDLRLAYMPPSSIASKKLDKDRHSANFVIIRLYADRDNDPALFSNTNKPYETASAVISSNQYNIGDFVLTLGYPNRSDRRALSAKLKEDNITISNAKLKILSAIDSLGYDTAQWRIDEIHKNIEQLRDNGVIAERAASETLFLIWAANHPDFIKCLRYGNVIPKIDKAYEKRRNYVVKAQYLRELLSIVRPLHAIELYNDIVPEIEEEVFAWINTYFVNFDIYKERIMLYRTLEFLESEFDSAIVAPVFTTERVKFKGNREKYINEIFKKSIMTDEKRFVKFLDNPTHAVMQEDILVQLYNEINKVFKIYYFKAHESDDSIAALNNLYREGLGEKSPNLNIQPDANYTYRMSYGTINGYSPNDVTRIRAVSTLGGMFSHIYLKKETEPDSLLTQLYKRVPEAKNMNMTFLTNCDMVTGRTGYGVYDQNGEFIGMVIGGNSEAECNNLLYNGTYQRLIVLDMKFVLFILKHYSKASYILSELNIGEVEKTFSIKEIEKEEEGEVITEGAPDSQVIMGDANK